MRRLTDAEALALEPGDEVYIVERGRVVGPCTVAHRTGVHARSSEHVVLLRRGVTFEAFALYGNLLRAVAPTITMSCGVCSGDVPVPVGERAGIYARRVVGDHLCMVDLDHAYAHMGEDG